MLEPDIGIILRAGDRTDAGFLDHMRAFASEGSWWEVQMARRGVSRRAGAYYRVGGEQHCCASWSRPAAQ